MFGKYSRLILIVPLVGAALACNKKYPTASQMQLDLMDEGRSEAMGHLNDMSDNALLADMAIADFHFAGQSSELSGTGAARLDRMASVIKHYGGTIHYDTTKTDKALIDQRLEHVREYLKLAGCDMGKVKVEVGLPTGRGVAAASAIKIADRGTHKPTDGGSGPAAPAAPSSSNSN